MRMVKIGDIRDGEFEEQGWLIQKKMTQPIRIDGIDSYD